MGRARMWAVGVVIVVALALCGLTAYQIDATTGTKVKAMNAKGLVTDSHGRPLAGATVYFIDSALVDMTSPITPAGILAGTSEGYDEPLEDIVNNPDKAKTLPKAVTNKKGQFAVRKLNRDATFFTFVVPASTDGDHLPGGDASRIAFSPKALGKGGLTIHMSWKVPADATYIGTSACYVCHGAGSLADMTSNKHHGHALMFHKPGQDTANQDSTGHVGSSWNELASKFTLATQTAGARPAPVAPATPITYLSFTDYSTTTSINNGQTFAIYENSASTRVDPTTGKLFATWVKAYLWVTSNGNYNVTLENMIAPTDPNNFVTFSVPLTMGGYIRQRILVGNVPAPAGLGVPTLKGLYKFIGYQAITGSASQGNVSNYDRTRRAWSIGGSGGGSFTDFIDTTTKRIKFPTVAATTGVVSPSNVACAICHLGAGNVESFTDAQTKEVLAHTVSDPNGAYALGGDSSLQDMGITCEQCHGPGSRHREEALKGVFPATNKRTPPVDNSAKYIVNPALLGADRASLICGRCHQESSILDEEGKFPPVGISRADYLANYMNPTGKGTPASRLWQDGMHETGGHQSLTYSNYLLSKHSRNSRQLVACDDCHDAMGDSPYRYGLKGDPDDSATGLCLKCHAIDVTKHVPEKTGATMMGEGMKCINCHMPRTGKGGAGKPGLILGTPTGLSSDANIYYWQGDQSAHIWKPVAHKFNPGVAGVTPPGSTTYTAAQRATSGAMPIPYTNACGTCHDASKLQYQSPGL